VLTIVNLWRTGEQAMNGASPAGEELSWPVLLLDLNALNK